MAKECRVAVASWALCFACVYFNYVHQLVTIMTIVTVAATAATLMHFFYWEKQTL